MQLSKKVLLATCCSAVIWLLTTFSWGQVVARHNAARFARWRAIPDDVGPVTPVSSPKWTLLFPRHIPDEHLANAAVYDTATNQLIAFGGASFSAVPNDVVSLSNANGIGTPDWTTVILGGANGSPSGRTFLTAVYDETNSRMIVFGGCAFTGDVCTTLNDVWVLTNANGVSDTPAWIQLSPSGVPPAPRWGHAAAYDAVNNRMIVFGGDDLSVIFSDTWVLSHANGLGGTMQGFAVDSNSVWTLSNANGLSGAPVWKKIIANGAAGSPPKRDGHVAVYDSTNNRMVIFGGNANTATGFPQHNDTWVLANANGLTGTPQWTRILALGPITAGRTSPVGAYDAANNRLMIYSGVSWDGDFFSSWVLTGANGLP